MHGSLPGGPAPEAGARELASPGPDGFAAGGREVRWSDDGALPLSEVSGSPRPRPLPVTGHPAPGWSAGTGPDLAGSFPGGGEATVQASLLALVERFVRVGSWRFDRKGQVFELSREARHLTGVATRRLTLAEARLLFHAHDRDTVGLACGQLLRGHEAQELDHWIRRADTGEIRRLRSRAEPMVSPDGMLAGVIGASVDITETVGVGTRPPRHADSRGRAVAGPQEGVWLIDTRHRTVFVNSRMAELLGYSAGEMRGRPVTDFMDEAWQPVAASRLAEHEAGIAAHFDFGFRRRDGSELRAWVGYHPIFDECGRQAGALAMVIDMTEPTRREHAAWRRLREPDGPGPRATDFMAIVCHGLRDPLAPLIYAVHLLRARTLERERFAWCLGMISRQVEHLNRLVDDVIDFSRLTRGGFRLDEEFLDLRELAPEVSQMVQPGLEASGHALTLGLPADGLPILGDRARLIRLIVSLLYDTARHAAPGIGLCLAMERDDGWAILRVGKHGADAQCPRPRAPTDRTQSVAGAADDELNIGLMLARELARLHGGELHAWRDVRGFRQGIVVRLPLVEARPVPG